MNMHKLAGASVLAAALSMGAASAPAFAGSLHAGNSYGCTQNPNAAGCKTPPTSVKTNGSVSGVVPSGGNTAAAGGGAPAVAALPRTGGGSPTSPSVPVMPLLAISMTVAGLGVRRVSRSR